MPESSDPQSAGDGFRQTSQRILSGSAVVNTTRTGAAHIGRYVRNSFLYRWLTAEPNPEVIVIDLRETWTVGPILVVLEKVLTELDRARTGSHIESILKTTTTALRASPIRVIGTVVAALGAILTIGTLLTSGVMTSVVVGLVILFVGVIATRDNRDWQTLRETQLVEFLRRVLEPPSPPTETEDGAAPDSGVQDADQPPDEDRAK